MSFDNGGRRNSPFALRVLVSSTSSDSHTWNLVFLQLLLEEMGNSVRNLGPCVPDDLLVRECLEHRPDLVVMSSVNGHGFNDGQRVVRLLREQPELDRIPVVIGGKLGVSGVRDDDAARRLLATGFDAVFDDGDLDAFSSYVSGLPMRVAS